MVKQKIFRCYSVMLKKFLLESELEYFNVGVNDAGMTYWDFAKTPKFKKALDQWDELKGKK